MNRVVSIRQSEPGLYVVTFQRSGAEPVGRLLEVIANPPLEIQEWPVSSTITTSPADGVRTSLNGPVGIDRRKR